MKVVSCLLAALLVLSAYYVRLDSLLAIALLITAALTLLTLAPSVRATLIRSYALINMALMFFYFYRFFSAVPLLDYGWYMQLDYAPIWIVLLGGFVSMHVLADNSCCLKREATEPVTPPTLPRVWAALRERHASS